MASHTASLDKAARLALTVSRCEWAWISVELPSGAAPQRLCTAEGSDVAAALDSLAAQLPDGAWDMPGPGAGAAALPAACREQALRAGVRSYRAVRRSIPYGMGEGSCVIAVAGVTERAPDPSVELALELVADLFVEGVMVRSSASLPGETMLAQEQFRLLFESAPGLYLVLAPDTFRILAASNAYLAATMVTRAQVVGRAMFDVFPDDPDDADGTGVAALNTSLQRVRQTRLPDVMAVQRYPIRRPPEAGGGFELRYWSPINSPVLDPDGALMFIIHRVEDVTDYVLAHRPAGAVTDAGADAAMRKTTRLEAEIVLRSHELKRMADSLALSEQRLRQSQEDLRTLLETVQRVRDDERRRLAREVHDQLGQILTAAKIDIRLLQGRIAHPDGPPPAQEMTAELGAAMASVDLAIAAVQDISALLRPPELEEGGLVAALRWQAADMERRAGIVCTVLYEPDGYVEQPPFVAGELLRMCQEALTNVLRHAGAGHVIIQVAMRNACLLVRICDDGAGIPRSRLHDPASFGLKGMRERAASIRASIHVYGRRGRGTMVAIRRRLAYL